MSRVLQVAGREFSATALTKGFIIGGFVAPVVILAIMVVLFPLLLKQEAPAISGQVAVVDPTGQVVAGVVERLTPEGIEQTNREDTERAAEAIEELSGGATGALGGLAGRSATPKVKAPELEVVELAAGADVEAEKAPLREGTPQDGGRLALVVISPDAITRGEDGFGSYELFVKPKLDGRIQSNIRSAVAGSIRTSRVEGAGLDVDEIEALTQVEAVGTIEVSEDGERESVAELDFLLPGGLMILMMIAVFTSGSYLLTTTVEEKSSRVVEVMLSALSPMQFMTGKILGQLGVGLLVMVVYGGLGIAGLVLASLTNAIDPMTVVITLAFFFVAYFQIAAMMAAIGSAVNEMREAQSLMAPVMTMIGIPYLLWLPVSTNPNGTFATVCSFVPPINSFMMIIRVASTQPPPMWQVVSSLAIGLVATFVILWIAAKIFRVGLLMYGKPPNFRTLIRWVRMA